MPDAIDAAIESLSHKPIGGLKRSGARAEARKERRIASRIAKSLPEDVRRYYVRKFNGDIEAAFRRLINGSDHVCEKCGCHHSEPRAVIAGLEMVGAKQPVSQVQVNLFQKLGVSDESELASLAASGRRLESLTRDATASVEAILEESLATIELCLAERPEALQGVLARLGGASREVATSGVPIPGASPANGHVNGGPA